MPDLLTTSIVAVTVFAQLARVTRRGKIMLKAGEQTLLVDALPNSLDADSVRASGVGAGVTLLGVDVKTEPVTQSPQTLIAELETRLEQLGDERQALTDEAATLGQQWHFFESLGKNSSRKLAQALDSNSGGSLAAATELSTYLMQQMNQIQTTLRTNNQHIRELDRTIVALQAKLQTIRQTRTQPTVRQISVTVRAEAPVEFEIELTYAVAGAGWKPLYDLRLREDNEVELTYLAHVWQQTGEDWQGVEMALSTARPATSIRLPKLPTWYIGVDRPLENIKAAKRFQAQERMVGGLDDLVLDDYKVNESMYGPQHDDGVLEQSVNKPRAVIAQSSISETRGGASVTYKIGGVVSVPSDGAPHKTTVAIMRLPAQLDYVTAPKLTYDVYLRATVTNTSAYMLLPGDASIFHGDEFIGRTRLSKTHDRLIAPNEEFKVQLGVDDRIKVERELMNREASQRYIGMTRRISYMYRISVTNLLPTSAKINVYDQYPVASDTSVKIQEDKAQPEPTEKTELGELTWTFELAANGQQDIWLGFTLEHARNTQIAGLPD